VREVLRPPLGGLHERAGAPEGRMRFTSFLPAISKDALKKISAEIRS
jgi:hypothetical protein